MKLKYSEEFREQALQKLLQRGDKTIECMATVDVNITALKIGEFILCLVSVLVLLKLSRS